MATPPNLFDPPAPSKRGALPTSAAQGEAIREDVGPRRFAVLRCFFEWSGSLTADEAGARLGLEPLSARPRTSELLKAGWLEPTGATRPTAGGGKGAALRLSNKGATVYQQVRHEPNPVAALDRLYRERRAQINRARRVA